MEKALLLLGGCYKDYKNNETMQSKIVGIMNLETGIFKGIEVLNTDCELEDYHALLSYVHHCYQAHQTFSLIAGYYDGKKLQYRNLLVDYNVSFGDFELDETEARLIGREKTCYDGKLARNLNRPVNRYSALVFCPQILSYQGKTEFVHYFMYLYELIEAILVRENCNLGWKGIQVSMENMAPKKAEKVYMLTPSIDEVK